MTAFAKLPRIRIVLNCRRTGSGKRGPSHFLVAGDAETVPAYGTAAGTKARMSASAATSPSRLAATEAST